MAKKKSLHERMKANPKDWQIADVKSLCAEFGLTINPPTGGGSHYRIKAKGVAFVLTIPARRPIKALYIKLLTSFIDDHCVNTAGEKG